MHRAVLVLFLLFFAGCTTDEPAVEPETGQTSTLGAISGSTVTPAIMPIPNVLVRIPQAQIETDSSLFGGFRFEALPPGTYRLEATADGYEPANLTVTVTAGSTTKARMIMKEDLPPVADSGTENLDGAIPAGFGPAEPHADPIKEAVGAGNCTCVLEFDAPEALQTIVLDLRWTDPYGDTSPMELRWNVTTDAGTSATGKGVNPINVHVADPAFVNATRVHVTILPDEVRPTQDLRFELFATWWTVDAAPDGWSIDG